ncbi:hypothetical protein D3H55_16530 [Bacillus salacetis]|uniref:Uncharacterized protein n=1 Tax=Bacillus salacetis TaxID=2315464 RepID=A0A3A1QYN0_9BACI|nr:hypothetical protein [Bacillus salacetis]RIW30732.1 hypothetical protein D3H55_16530 [Bacillus salacetis]
MTGKHAKESNQNYTFNNNCVDPINRSVNIPLSQPCNSAEQLYFEDLTYTPGSYLITVSNNTVSCSLIVIVESFNGQTTERTVLPNASIGFLEEDVQGISIRCEGDSEAVCTGNLSVSKYFRFCVEEVLDEDNCLDSPWLKVGSSEDLLKFVESLKKHL